MLLQTFMVIMLFQPFLCDAKRNAFGQSYSNGKQPIPTRNPIDDMTRITGPQMEFLRPYYWLMENKYFKKRNILF